jgi:hypothetical protein
MSADVLTREDLELEELCPRCLCETTADCGLCEGTGYVLTTFGESVIAFLNARGISFGKRLKADW